MKTRTKITLGALALAGLAATAATAHGWGERDGGGHGGRGAMMLRLLDANGDDRVTPEEARELQIERLQRSDVDGDGALSIDEFAPLFAEVTRERMVRGFQRLDRDGDGVVTEAEMTAPADRLLRFDRDGDGDVDVDDRRR